MDVSPTDADDYPSAFPIYETAIANEKNISEFIQEKNRSNVNCAITQLLKKSPGSGFINVINDS
jgi:hypothetical protein